MLKKFGLLPRVIVAIILGLLLGQVADQIAGGIVFVRVFATFNDLFGQYLGFCIPLIILGLVAPGIADLGKSGGRLLLLTLVLAYLFTLFSGFFAYFSCSTIFPGLLGDSLSQGNTTTVTESVTLLEGFFTLEIPPIFSVMTALVLAFTLGIGMTLLEGNILKNGFLEFRTIVEKVITATIIPLLPLHIFGLFLRMAQSGQAFEIIADYGKVIAVIFILHIVLLLLQFSFAGIVARRNPLRMLLTMLPAYMTALGTSSSAATIPVTLRQAKKLGVKEDIADFCIPLCATIHLAGSTLKITATALAICMMNAMPHNFALFAGFIFLLGVMMVAAPGVPGGAIMAAIGVLQSVLGFGEAQVTLMIALYIAIDSFGTAGNVTGDGAITVIVDRIAATPDR